MLRKNSLLCINIKFKKKLYVLLLNLNILVRIQLFYLKKLAKECKCRNLIKCCFQNKIMLFDMFWVLTSVNKIKSGTGRHIVVKNDWI